MIESRIKTAAVLALGALLLAAPQAAAAGFARGVQLCLHSVLPALFPFFVVCGLLTASPAAAGLGRLLAGPARRWGLHSEAAPLALVLSWLGGYAVCARSMAELRAQRRLTAHEAELVLLLGCCSGPGFVVGCLGGLMLGSVRLGVLLYALQLAANLLAAACLLPWLPGEEGSGAAHAHSAAPDKATVYLPQAITAAVDSSLQVCGCTVFFCVLDALLQPFVPAAPLFRACLSGLLEISSGCAAFAALGGGLALYGLSFCLSVPGLSVLCQLLALLDGRVPVRRLLVSRLLHFAFLQGLVRLCAPALPGAAAAVSTLGARVIPMRRLPPDAAAICFIFLCCALYKLRKNLYNRQGGDLPH